jgi:DNA-binding transcriptional LysR family regulator
MLHQIDLSRVDLNLLVIFSVVFEEGHVARAAGRLNLTPSAVSHALGRLRVLLNDPLFLRTPKGVVPTTRALELGEPVAEILNRVGSVMASATPFDARTSRRRFVIGAPDAAMSSLMSAILERVGAHAPHVDISLLHLMPEQRGGPGSQPWQGSFEKLEKRHIDVAVLPLRAVPPRFEAHRLFDEDFVVAMRKGHRFARSPSLAEYCSSQHLLVSLSGDPHGFVDELLAKRGLKRRIALTVPTFMMALAHLASSDLIAALPRRLAGSHAARFGLTSAELPFKRKPDPILAIATKAAMMDDGVSWLMEVLVSSVAPGLSSLGLARHRRANRGNSAKSC